MEVYLVRHTEPVCEKGICYGQSDVAIKEPYLEQFEKIKKQLPENAVYYSSPLQRCTILTDYLSSSKFYTDERLKEMHFGNWEMRPWDVIPQEEMTPWMQNFVEVQVPNGESFIQLYNRVKLFIDELLSKNESKSIVLVTHAGVIRSILCYYSKLPLADAFQNKVDFAQVIKINL